MIQHVGFFCETVCYLRKKLSRDLGSPGSRQLLQLQLFSQILKFWTLLLILSCLDLFWIAELSHSSATILIFEFDSR